MLGVSSKNLVNHLDNKQLQSHSLLPAVGMASLVVGSLLVIGLFPGAIIDSATATATAIVVVVGGALTLAALLAKVPLASALLIVIAMRAPLIVIPPVLSDDAFRYVHEGRAGRVALDVPYRFPPARVSLPYDDDVSARVNHPDVSAAYPPFTQLWLIVTTRLGDALSAPLVVHKAFLLAFDAMLIGLLFFCRRSLVDSRAAVAYGTHPLPLIALGLGPHLDVMGAFLLTAALLLARATFGSARIDCDRVLHLLAHRTRDVAAGFLLGLAAHVKPLALVGVVALPRRLAAAIGLALGLVGPTIPYVVLGAPLIDGIAAYGSRWRASPVLFPLFEAIFSSWDSARIARDTWMHVHLDLPSASLLLEESGRAMVAIGDVTPDAIRIVIDGAFFSRALAGCGFVVLAVFIIRSRVVDSQAAKVATLIVAFLFLTPTLHPWYFLWVLPIGAAMGSLTIHSVALAALALYAPKLAELRGDGWSESVLTSVALISAFTLGVVLDRRRVRLSLDRAPTLFA
jgi:hypothetical protein